MIQQWSCNDPLQALAEALTANASVTSINLRHNDLLDDAAKVWWVRPEPAFRSKPEVASAPFVCLSGDKPNKNLRLHCFELKAGILWYRTHTTPHSFAFLIVMGFWRRDFRSLVWNLPGLDKLYHRHLLTAAGSFSWPRGTVKWFCFEPLMPTISTFQKFHFF